MGEGSSSAKRRFLTFPPVRYFFRTIYRWGVPFASRRFRKTHRSRPVECFDKIEIYGSLPFRQDVETALGLLKADFPYGYSMVKRYIRAIEQIVEPAKPIKSLAGIGVRYEKTGLDGKLRVEPSRYGALLVRIATSQRWAAGFFIPKSPRTELLELKIDLAAMRRLRCDARYFHFINNKIIRLEEAIRARPK